MLALLRFLPSFGTILRLLPYAASGIAVAVIWWLWSERAEERAARQELLRQLANAERIAEQAELARDVADAEADRISAKAREYDALKEALIRGEDDAELPDWFIAYLGSLFANDQD